MPKHRVLQSLAVPATLTLHPGDVAVASAGQTLDTLLGSCVAVLLADSRRTIAALCHVVHARATLPGDTRFAGPAIDSMCAALRARGFEPRYCEARLYGGGNMFPGRYMNTLVGDANVDSVAKLLRDAAIPVVEHDVGGPYYRRFIWTVGEGQPVVRRTPLDANGAAVSPEHS